MSVYLNIAQPYYIRRINQWHINIKANTIYGNMQLYNLSAEYPINGRIIGLLDNHLMVIVQYKLYALVLGNVSAGYKQCEQVYIDYIKTKSPKIILVL